MRFGLARKEVERQLWLFGVGDLGGSADEDGSSPEVGSAKIDWETVMGDLGRILREGRFETYLARPGCSNPDDPS